MKTREEPHKWLFRFWWDRNNENSVLFHEKEVPAMRLAGLRLFAAECRGMGKDGPNAWRVTTTLSVRQREDIQRLARENGVKVAWLIRRSVERLLDEAHGQPLLPLEFKKK